MNQTTHTPEPWTPVTGQGAHHRDIYIRHGQKQDDGSWPAVAKCCSRGVGTFATVQANARLIASAPDLLAAMQSIALIANGGHGTPATNLAGIFKKATEAIAKATK